MATMKRRKRGQAAQAALETARLGVSTIIEGVAGGIIEIGAAAPVVAPLCVALLKAKGIVDGVSRSKEELEQLRARCDMITLQVIDRCRGATPFIDVSPLAKCIDKLAEVAQRYHGQGTLTRMAQFRRDGDDIQRLRGRIEGIVSIMGLVGVINMSEGVVNIQDQLEDVQRMLAQLRPRPALAAVPKGVPIGQSWHTVRDGVVDRVCQILDGGDEPTVAALTGRSGAGKTTAAAAVVGERGPIRPRAGEGEDQTRTRLDRVRALFPDGVVWLRVGRGGGAPDRLGHLVYRLAKAVYEDVMGKNIDAPKAGEDGENYVKKVVLQESLRCLVVADDVWEEEVIEKLRKTGMWVLMTTRKASMVEPSERVVVEELTPAEAEDVLRGAARLPPGERLCDNAMGVLEICGHVAMDIAFVGSWSCVRTADNGVPTGNGAWADAVRKITTQIDELKARAVVGNDEEVGDLEMSRRAVLRAGFKFLGAEDAVAQELYIVLAVLPDGHAFKDSDAAVLLNDEEPLLDHHMEVAMSAIAILERWAVLRADASGLYRMHDAHVELAKNKLMDRRDVKKSASRRWTSHISRLEVMVGIDVYTLFDMWSTLENVGGEIFWVSHPYDNQLLQMDASDRSKVHSMNAVVQLYHRGSKYKEIEALMRKVLRDCDNDGANPEVKMAALYYIRDSLLGQERYAEANETRTQLGELVGFSLKALPSVCGDGFAQTPSIFNMFGVCAEAAGRRQDAENWFLKALKVQEDGGFGESSVSVFTLHELGVCVREAGRPEEAEGFLKRALEIREAKLAADDLQVACTLHDIGKCVRKAGRPSEAIELLERALEIREAELAADDLQVAYTLHELGRCARDAGRLGEAESLLKRALEIKEAKCGADDLSVAHTLYHIGRCVREAGRPGEAKGLLGLALEIREAKLPPNDLQVAWTLQEIGRCEWEVGLPGKAEEWLKRTLAIKEVTMGGDDLSVARTLFEMGACVREAGRPGDAEGLLKRALAIREAKLGGDDL